MTRNPLRRPFLALLVLIATLCTATPALAETSYQVNRAPDVAFVPLSGGTQIIGGGVDDTYTRVDLPFTVYAYGQPFTSISPSSNGTVVYGPEGSAVYSISDGTQFPGPTMSAFGADLTTPEGGRGVLGKIEGTAGSRTYTVEWNVNSFPDFDTLPETAQVQMVFHENSHRVDTYYRGTLDRQGWIGVKQSPQDFTRYGGSTVPYPSENTHLVFSILSIEQPGSPSRDNTPTVSGVGENSPGAGLITVRIFSGTTADGAPLASQVVPPDTVDGSYETAPFAELADGTYTVEAFQSDGAGQTTRTTAPLVVDTVAPTPELTAPPETTADATPTLSGRLGTAPYDLATGTLNVHAGTDTSGAIVRSPTVAADAEGAFAVDLDTLPEGTYTAQVVQADAAGNSAASLARTFVVDTTAPALTVTSPAGRIGSGPPVVAGTAGTAPGDASEVSIRFVDGAGDAVGDAFTATVGTDGAYRVESPRTLPDGDHEVRVAQTDVAGNTTTASSTFTVDATAPTGLTVESPSPGDATTDRTPLVAGRADTVAGDEPTVGIAVHDGGPSGTVVQSFGAALDAAGNYRESVPADLAPGDYTVVVTRRDDVGNVQSASVSFRVSYATADVSVVAQASADRVHAGDTITKTFTVSASGTDAEQSVLTVPLPAATELVSATAGQGSCATAGPVVCDLGRVAAGGQAVVSVVLRTTQAGTVTTTGSVRSANPDPAPANNSASASTTVEPVIPAPAAPARAVTIGTVSARVLGQHAVRLRGTVDPHGHEARYHVEYGLTAGDYRQRTEELVSSADGPVPFDRVVDGLELGRTYHYRVVATGPAGTVRSGDRTFRTRGRQMPRSVSVATTPAADRTFPYRFTTTGRVTRPAGVTGSESCRGTVTVRFQARGTMTISSRRVALRGDCTYRSSVTLRRPGRFVPGRGTLRVRAFFSGNQELRPRRSPTYTVGVPRR